jgi:hypothetical protein
VYLSQSSSLLCKISHQDRFEISRNISITSRKQDPAIQHKQFPQMRAQPFYPFACTPIHQIAIHHIIKLFKAPHVHAVAFKNGGLVGFVMDISEISFYCRMVHVSKYTSSLSFYSIVATATTPRNMTYMLPHFNFCVLPHTVNDWMESTTTASFYISQTIN